MPNYREALAALNPAQRAAVETIDGPVLVIAGPGTGKTQLLTTRIAHILSKTDTLPRNILCLTFTDSAAQTMRERLSSIIGQDAYDVTISTYHSFGSDIIRRFPEYFPENAGQKPADDLTIDRIFRQIIDNLPYSSPLKYSDNYLNDVKTLVSDAKRALLSPDDLRQAARENLKFIQSINPSIRRILGTIPRMNAKHIPLFAELAKQIEVKPSNSKWQPLAAQFLRELEEAVAASIETGKTKPLVDWKDAWLAKDENGEFIANGIKTNQKLSAVADVYEQYLMGLKARGLFDYDDMILRAVHVLETNADLRFTLQEQYLYILLDEFQDTNEAQLRLVELLADNPVNEGRPNILAVGDDDQAIYAFQGADYSHMVKFKEMYRDVTEIPITENYRSHADILRLSKGIGDQISERLARDKTLTAAAKNLPERAAVERREAKSDVMQYAWVTKRIKELVEQGVEPSEIAVLAPKHRYLEPLVPFLTQESIPIRYEKSENVLDDPAVNQLLRMAELTLALSEGDHPRANALWPQVLSFGFWELPTSLIWQLSWRTTDRRGDWTGELLSDGRLKPIALFFIRLSQISGTETLETMVDHIIGTRELNLNEPGLTAYKSPYYDHYFGELAPGTTGKINADLWNLLSNLIVLRARLREYLGDGEESLTLGHFVEFVRAHREANIKVTNTSPYASGTDAVQLMTAYKAKGMEFKAVFLLAVNDEVWGGRARSAGTSVALPPNLQYVKRYSGATEDERLRLLYVAVTRAKHHLYLVSFTQNYAGKNMTRLKYLDESPDETDIVVSRLLPEGRQEILPAENGVAEPTTELAAYWQQRHETALTSTDMQALLQDRLKNFQLSATHISDFVDFTNCGPQSFFMLRVLRFPQAPRPGLDYGYAIHETLEWIHNEAKKIGQVPGAAAVHKTFAYRLETKRLSAHDLRLYLERGKEVLSAYLKQRAHTISPNNIVEYNFRGEGVFAGDARLGGKIDKLVINKETKEIVIVDYKTGRSHTKWSRDIHLHKNRQQLYFYKMLVEGSHTFAGYKVTGAYLEFVEPDENGKIQELHLKFDKDESRHIKKLAESVWQHIMSLDLPETTGYSQDLKGIEQFEDDLAEG